MAVEGNNNVKDWLLRMAFAVAGFLACYVLVSMGQGANLRNDQITAIRAEMSQLRIDIAVLQQANINLKSEILDVKLILKEMQSSVKEIKDGL
jgi:hypothetical protein